MKYAYFPGCSLRGTGKAFEESFLSVAKVLGIELEELEDWNCCGATAYMSLSMESAVALASRNLALADRTGLDMVTPCAGCYGVLIHAASMNRKYSTLTDSVRQALGEEGLEYRGTSQVKHPLDILANDYGADEVGKKVVRPLIGLRVACYYGCRLLRPEAPFEDRYDPVTMEMLVEAIGAKAVEYPLKSRCCGGSLTGTMQDVGQNLCYFLLSEAIRRQADVVATACPLCQFNLECYQDNIRKAHPELKPIPVVAFTQLIGLALGLGERELGLDHQIIPLRPALERIAKSDKVTAGGDA